MAFLGVAATISAEVRIGEFLAVSGDGLRDEDGEAGDWIEVVNEGEEAASLAGYALTDDVDQPGKWVFPDVSLGAGERLVVFASGKGRSDPAGELHTGFELDGGGEYLALVSPAGEVVQDFGREYPEQREGVSYGIGLDGELGYFVVPTPGGANGVGLLGFAEEVAFSVGRGVFDAPFRVELEADEPGARILYTLDGGEPSLLRGRTYDGAIAVGQTTVLRARSLVPGLVPSRVTTRTYVFPAGSARGGEMAAAIAESEDYETLMEGSLTALPVLSLAVEDEEMFGPSGIYSNAFGSGEIDVSVEFFNSEEEGEFGVDAGLKIHGGQARTHEKKPMRLHFRERYGARRLEFPLFAGSPVTSFDALVLRGGGHDAWTSDWGDGRNDLTESASYLRDEFLRRTELEMGLLSPRGRWVQLFINGRYHGMFDVHERVAAAFFADHEGGKENDWDVVKPEGGTQTTPPVAFPADGDLVAWQNLQAAAAGGDDEAFLAVQEFLDLDGYIDSLITRIWSGDHDWIAPVVLRFAGGLEFELNATNNRNWFAGRRSRGESGAFHFFTWDGEISMGNDRFQTPGASDVNRETGFDLTLVGEANSPAVAYAALRGNGEFRLRFGDRLQKHFFAGGALAPDVAVARWVRLGGLVREALVAESARWGNLHGGEPLTRDAEWQEEFEWVRDEFLRDQSGRVLGYFRDRGLFPETSAPVFSLEDGYVEAGQRLEIGNPNGGGRVYFTTDGSDPRQGVEVESGVLLEEFSEASYLVPTEANGGASLGGGWRWGEPPANATEWSSGRAGIGYETVAADYADLVRSDTGGEMAGVAGSVFVRVPFRIDDPEVVRVAARLVLQMKYDDGFVAYLNGVEVARANAPAEPAWDSFATGSNPDTAAVIFESFDLSAARDEFVEGENVLAIHGLNVAPESSDFLVSPRIVYSGEVQPAGVAAGAVEYKDGFLLGRSTTVSARVLSDDGEWSPVVTGVYAVDLESAGASNVVISELHYRPRGVMPGEEGVAGGRGDFEFVEIANVWERGVDLAGARFSDGVAFTFPEGEASLLEPGGRVVVVSNEEAFRVRYGTTARVAGEFEEGTRLSNGGETVTLVSGSGGVIASFRYDDRAPWPEEADGDGASVVLRDVEAGRGATAGDWRASFVSGGTPGGVEGDTDGDGLIDAWEVRFFGGLDEEGGGDRDGDGLEHLEEMALGTNPLEADSDGDGLSDGDEIGVSDPMFADSDGDGVPDGEETGRSDPLVADEDRDGLDDGEEITAGTDPRVADSDGDGVGDGEEVARGSDPGDPAVRPLPGEGDVLVYSPMDDSGDVLERIANLVGDDGAVVDGEAGAEVDAVAGGGVALDGTISYGETGDAGAGSLTVSFWFKGDVDEEEQVLVGKGGGRGWGIYFEDGRVRWTVGERSVEAGVSGDGWHHVALRIGRGSGKIEGAIDGVRLEVGDLERGEVISSVQPLAVGRFAGAIDELVVWRFPLSNDELERVFVAGRDSGLGGLDPVLRPGDLDGDGMADAWEVAHFGDLGRDGQGDFDQDGLKDREEFDVESDPTKGDSDADGKSDLDEVLAGSDPGDGGSVGGGRVNEGLLLRATLDRSDRSGTVAGAVVFDSTVPGEHGRIEGVVDDVVGVVGEGLGLRGGGVVFEGVPGAGAGAYSVGLWVRVGERSEGVAQVVAEDVSGAWALGVFGDRFGATGRTGEGRQWMAFNDQPAPGTRPATGEWTFLMLVFDRAAGEVRLFVNGVEAGYGPGERSLVPGDETGGGDLVLGRRFSGEADEFSVWDRAVGADEVAAVYRGGRAGVGASAVGGDELEDGDIEVAPGEVLASLNPGEAVEMDVGIRNAGGGLINYLRSVEFGDREPLDVVLERLEEDVDQVAGLVPQRFLFSEGNEGFFIEDGGGDMFDFANILSTSLGGPIEYTDGDLVESDFLGSGGRYFTLKENGVFVFAGDVAGVDVFEISGNLGADGEGSVDGNVFEVMLGTRKFRGFSKRVWDGFDPRTGTTDPSVNHLVLVEDGGVGAHTFSRDTDDDAHAVSGLAGASRIYYLMYGAAEGRFIDDEETRAIAAKFLEVAGVQPGWLEAEMYRQGQLLAGEEERVAVRFDAGEIGEGRYEAVFQVVSNDPDEGVVLVPLVLEVNHTPTSSGLPLLTIDEDAPAARVPLADHFDDEEEGGALDYSVVSNSSPLLLATVEIDESTGELVVAPGEDLSGVGSIGVRAADSRGLAVEAVMTVVVVPVNDAPVGLAVPEVRADAMASDVVVDLSRFFVDPDEGDVLSYSLPGRSSGIFESLSIDAASGVLRASFVETMVGRAFVRVVATDVAGEVGETVLTVVLGASDPLVVAAGGLVEEGGSTWVQEVVVRNAGERDVAGFELVVTGAGEGFEIDGGVTDGDAVVVGWPGVLRSGEGRTVVLRYRGGGGAAPGAVRVEAGTTYGVVKEGFRVSGVSVSGEVVVLRFPTRAGTVYRVESGETIGRWEITGPAVAGDGGEGEWRWEIPAGSGRRFFRVVEIGGG